MPQLLRSVQSFSDEQTCKTASSLIPLLICRKGERIFHKLDLGLVLPVLPSIQHGPQVFSTIEGTPVTLPCQAVGVPSPENTWTKVRIYMTTQFQKA